MKRALLIGTIHIESNKYRTVLDSIIDKYADLIKSAKNFCEDVSIATMSECNIIDSYIIKRIDAMGVEIKSLDCPELLQGLAIEETVISDRMFAAFIKTFPKLKGKVSKKDLSDAFIYNVYKAISAFEGESSPSDDAIARLSEAASKSTLDEISEMYSEKFGGTSEDYSKAFESYYTKEDIARDEIIAKEKSEALVNRDDAWIPLLPGDEDVVMVVGKNHIDKFKNLYESIGYEVIVPNI